MERVTCLLGINSIAKTERKRNINFPLEVSLNPVFHVLEDISCC